MSETHEVQGDGERWTFERLLAQVDPGRDLAFLESMSEALDAALIHLNDIEADLEAATSALEAYLEFIDLPDIPTPQTCLDLSDMVRAALERMTARRSAGSATRAQEPRRSERA